MQDNFAYLLPFIMLSFGVVFLFIRSMSNRSALFWGLGYLCAGLGFAAPMLIVSLPFEAQAIVSNAVFFAAFFFYGHALLVHFDQPSLISVRASIGIAAFLVVSANTILIPDLRRELIVGDITCALLLALPIWFVRKQPKMLAERLLVIVVSLVVVETLVRVVMLVIMTPNGTMVELGEFFSSDYAFFMQVCASILGFLMGLCVLASLVSGMLGKHVHAAEHDPLTDLLNRRGFDRVAPDFRGETPVGAIITCDIDHFKQINDHFGHAAGDIVIIGLSEMMRKTLPDSAVVARFGGEEFVAYLPGYQTGEAGALANTIRLDFAGKDWRSRGIMQQITVSFGVSAIARGDHSIHDAIARADASLYMAKSGGRNHVVLEGARIPAAAPLKIISNN